MTVCEMCGKSGSLVTALVEGVSLNLCPSCVKYGTVTKQKVFFKHKKREITERVESIVPDYAKMIRDARGKTGMSQEDFAKKLMEKESVIHKIETGKMEPSIPLARKLEKSLGLRLVEEEVAVKPQMKTSSGSALTIGDMLNRR